MISDALICTMTPPEVGDVDLYNNGVYRLKQDKTQRNATEMKDRQPVQRVRFGILKSMFRASFARIKSCLYT